MCVDQELSERNRKKRNRRWRFHRLRDSSRNLDGIIIRPAADRRFRRIDSRPVVRTGQPESQAYVASPGLIAAATVSQRLQDARDARRFAEQYPFAGHAA